MDGYVDGTPPLTDRKAYMIISGGVNIYPQEAENVLVTHPKVVDAAVFGVPDPEFGESVRAAVELAPENVAPDLEDQRDATWSEAVDCRGLTLLFDRLVRGVVRFAVCSCRTPPPGSETRAHERMPEPLHPVRSTTPPRPNR